MNDSAAANSIKILVADDSHPVHQLFRGALEDPRLVSLAYAPTGAECLDAFADGVDVAVIDIHMPEMNGIEALWAARARGGKTFVAVMPAAEARAASF